jgi:3-methylcrotonyl-CoA carboxylase alpha subunit
VRGLHPAPEAHVLAAAALWVLSQENRSDAGAGGLGVWGRSDGWRLNAQLARTLQFESVGGDLPRSNVTVQYGPDGLLLGFGESRTASTPAALTSDGGSEYHLRLGAEGVRVQIEAQGGELRIGLGHSDHQLRWCDPRAPVVEGDMADGSLAAPMPGRIIAHVAAVGSQVSRGAPLLIMEAMKMEHTICAPANGRVRAYLAAVGQQVTEGTELIDFEAQG